MSAWNDFVKKIYWEGKKKNPNYEFKQALQDASKRKGEMGASTAKGTKSKKSSRKSKKGGKKCGKRGGTRRKRH